MPPPVVRPPSDIRLVCSLVQSDGTLLVCPSAFEQNDFTNTWDHQINGHPGQQVRWTLQGTNSGQE
jgi:hypothetical protein